MLDLRQDLLLRTGSRIRNGQLPLLILIVRVVQGYDLLLLLPPQEIDADVAGQPVKPGGKGGVEPVGGKAAPGFQEGFWERSARRPGYRSCEGPGYKHASDRRARVLRRRADLLPAAR